MSYVVLVLGILLACTFGYARVEHGIAVSATADAKAARNDLAIYKQDQAALNQRIEADRQAALQRAAAAEAERDANAKRDAKKLAELVRRIPSTNVVTVSDSLKRVFDATGATDNASEASAESSGQVATIAIPGATYTYREQDIGQWSKQAKAAYADVMKHWSACVAEYEATQ